MTFRRPPIIWYFVKYLHFPPLFPPPPPLQVCGLGLSLSYPPRALPFFLYNLSPEPRQPSWLTFYTCYFLNKLSLVFGGKRTHKKGIFTHKENSDYTPPDFPMQFWLNFFNHTVQFCIALLLFFSLNIIY